MVDLNCIAQCYQTALYINVLGNLAYISTDENDIFLKRGLQYTLQGILCGYKLEKVTT